jgi:predicted AAA+ superfamily ATPase
MSKQNRYIQESAYTLALERQKMLFVSGPRQCGKTTFSKSLKKLLGDNGAYYTWDHPDFRRRWQAHPDQLIAYDALSGALPVFIFDEIHKAPQWKQTLKGIYDTKIKPCHMLVTGSARLNVYKKGGDSMLGRYLLFRLHPFSFGELSPMSLKTPDAFLSELQAPTQGDQTLLETLMVFGGFPEPFLAQSHKISRIWKKDRLERLVREDLRDLSRLPELGQIEVTTSLMPARVGSPISIPSLREDLGVAYDTVKRWLGYLEALYYHFEIKPWSKRIPRSLKKEGKLYLWDWSEIVDEGPRFENLIASHLLKACHFWTDSGEGIFDLFYLKDKEKREIDFLVTKDGQPWLPVECKLHNRELSPNFEVFLRHIKVPFFVQVIASDNVYRPLRVQETPGCVLSAAAFLRYLP